MMAISRAFAFGLVFLANAARADAPRPAPMQPPKPVSIQAYGEQNPACLEWSDGCVICAKGHCSTPGIACQPGGVVCRKLAK